MHRSVREPGTFIDAAEPYGYGDHDFAGVAVDFRAGAGDVGPAPRNGMRLAVRAEHFPAILDARSDWSALSGTWSGSITPGAGMTPTFAARLGAEHRFGLFPYTEAAHIGGSTTVRGLANRRFAGRSAAFASGEVRAPIADFHILLPGTLGVLGLTDVGRVWVSDDTSRKWHSAWGGGLWVSFLSGPIPEA
jgi:hypothetical protein